MATMMDLDKDREVARRTVREKGPLAKVMENFADRKSSMKREQMAEGEVRRNAGMGSSKNVDTGTGRGTTMFEGEKTFKQAFAEARKAGKDQFTWKGKKYTTEMAKPQKAESEATIDSDLMEAHNEAVGYKSGGCVKMAKGGSASSRADGCAQRGKTKGRMV
jgi:hypothetical protein